MKRFLAVVLCLVMLVGLLPAAAFAQELEDTDMPVLSEEDFFEEAPEELSEPEAETDPGDFVEPEEDDFPELDEDTTEDTDEVETALCGHGNEGKCEICAVEALIEQLPTSEELAEMDEAAFAEAIERINSAIEAYLALTAEQQALVGDARELLALIEQNYQWFDSDAISRLGLAKVGRKLGAAGSSISYTYNTSTKTLTITGTGNIPDYTSESDTPWASKRSSTERIVIGEGITGIGNNAFRGFAFVSDVSLPDSLQTIGSKAFTSNYLIEVTIPAGVKSICSESFSCSRLEAYHVAPDSMYFLDDDGVLYQGTTLLAYPGARPATSYIVPAGTKTLEECAFKSPENLLELTLPAGLETVYYQSFSAYTAKIDRQNR